MISSIRTVVLLFAIASIGVGCSKETGRSELLPGEVLLGTDVPTFVSPLLSGDSLRTDDLMGKVSLVNFWATWCGPCIIEIPEFVALQQEWKDRPFQFVGVSMDEKGFEEIETFVSDFEMNYPQIADIGPLADSFGGVWALPTTFIVDHNGTVLSSFTGPLPLHQIREEIDRLVIAAENQ